MGVDAEMFVRTRHPVTEADVKRWRYELASAFGADGFWIWRAADGYGSDRHSLDRVDVFTQDGDDIVPETGETFLRVNPATRYYGEGYERGDLPFLLALAAYLEQKIPGASVWYGGDSSGICAEPFDQAARDKLFAHFVNVDHRPYVGGFGALSKDDHVVMCDFCEAPMTQHGFGPNYAAYNCRGCGRNVETRDHGKTYALVKERL